MKTDIFVLYIARTFKLEVHQQEITHSLSSQFPL